MDYFCLLLVSVVMRLSFGIVGSPTGGVVWIPLKIDLGHDRLNYFALMISKY